MKKLIKAAAIVMTLVLAVSMNTAFAAPAENVNGQIMNSFRQDFQNAQLMSTDISKNFSKLTFKMDGNVLTAFYSENGELLAVSRNIVSTTLPISLFNSLKKHQDKAWLTELFEIKADNQNTYYATIENAETKTVLRSNGFGWEIYSSAKK